MELTYSELQRKYLKESGYNWLGRDINGQVFAYKIKPEKNLVFCYVDENESKIDFGKDTLNFPWLTWEMSPYFIDYRKE